MLPLKNPLFSTLVDRLPGELLNFCQFGKATQHLQLPLPQAPDQAIDVYINEFWTAKQRAAHSLHEVSYRACFKPQLPRFFIERLTQPGERVYDPFMGRGTTLLEAALLGRVPCGNDINPLSLSLVSPRLNPPTQEAVAARLATIPWEQAREWPEELLAFYHPKTLRQIVALKEYLLDRGPACDTVDRWIAMVALNRLTGHSPGFFSVYTLPPNQAVSLKTQLKINATRQQVPPVRQVPVLILKKTRQLLGDFDLFTHQSLASVVGQAQLINCPAHATASLADDSVALVVTSPPFLDVVDYAGDNWLRCWFLGIDPKQVALTVPRRLEDWEKSMTAVLRELHRVVKPGGHVAFEVGEVRKGKIKLDQSVLACGLNAGFTPRLILINDQKFTKTANCWGVDNNSLGTNTNRIVLLGKEKG